MTRIIPLAVVFAALVLSGLAGGCSTLPPQNGPVVGVRNDSDTPLRVRFWIGDRRQQAAGTPLKLSADKVLEVRPYGTTQYRLGAFSGYESPSESFVRVQVEPIGPTFQASTQYWYEFNPPSPFVVHVFGTKPDLKFDRSGPGTMAFVPPAYWFHATPAPTPTVAAPSAARASNATTAPATATASRSTPTQERSAATVTTTTPVVSVPDTGMDSNR
ncbi:MAG: hypothetical protein IT438_17125 [Phycisphaerales bacterium]|nr:hypothetical protein [Phycisphaerales bacterium]